MTITQALATTFKVELGQGIHNFTTGGDTFRIALIKPNDEQVGNHNAATTNYSDLGADEVTGTGYTAGGIDLTNVTPVADGVTAVFDFGDATFSTVTLTTRGALIYNSTDSNRAVAVLDFGSDRVVTGGDIEIIFPAAVAASAIIRLT